MVLYFIFPSRIQFLIDGNDDILAKALDIFEENRARKLVAQPVKTDSILISSEKEDDDFMINVDEFARQLEGLQDKSIK